MTVVLMLSAALCGLAVGLRFAPLPRGWTEEREADKAQIAHLSRLHADAQARLLAAREEAYGRPLHAAWPPCCPGHDTPFNCVATTHCCPDCPHFAHLDHTAGCCVREAPAPEPACPWETP